MVFFNGFRVLRQSMGLFRVPILLVETAVIGALSANGASLR